MPVKSQAQRRLMYAAAAGEVPGISQAIGREFVQQSKGITGLPGRLHPPRVPVRTRRVRSKP